MKNRFKKIAILALSTISLLTIDPAKGADRDESKRDGDRSSSFLGTSSLSSQQRVESLALRLSRLLSEEEMIRLLDQGDNDLSRSVLGNSVLGSSMLGANSWSPEFELSKILFRKEGNKLFPSIDPLAIYHMIKNVLDLKAEVDLPEHEMRELKKFLAIHGGKLNLISDPNLLLTFLAVLDPLPKFSGHQPMMGYPMPIHNQLQHPSQVCYWVHELWNYEQGSRPTPLFLQQCSGIKKGQFVTSFDQFFTQLFNQIDSFGYMMHQPEIEQIEASKKRVRQEIIEAFNKMLNFGGHQLFDLEKDGKVLDSVIPEWFTIMSGLTHFKWKEWSRKADRMEVYLSSLNAASKALDLEDGKFYSGLVVGVAPNYTATLIRTDEKNAVDRKTLRVFLEEEREANKAKIEQYNDVKPHLSTLEKAVEWFDDIFSFVQKEGRQT